MHVEIKILDARLKALPSYATSGSAGFDVMACIKGTSMLLPDETRLISTGISIFINHPGYAGLLIPRSGLGGKGLVLGNLVGLIDSDYQGPLKVFCWNRGSEPFVIEPMMRIAQLLIVPVVQAKFKVVEEFTATDRGEGGFGSTGT